MSELTKEQRALRADLLSSLHRAQLKYTLVRTKIAELMGDDLLNEWLQSRQKVEQLEYEIFLLDRRFPDRNYSP